MINQKTAMKEAVKSWHTKLWRLKSCGNGEISGEMASAAYRRRSGLWRNQWHRRVSMAAKAVAYRLRK